MWCAPGEDFDGWDEALLQEMFYYCHYGLNGYVPSYWGTNPHTGQYEYMPRRITDFKVPSNVIFAQDHIEQTLDGAYSDMFTMNAGGINLSQWRQNYIVPYPECVSECFRHNRSSYTRKNMRDPYAVEKGLANNLWLDGHVSKIDETKGEDVQYRWYTGNIVDPSISRWDQ